MWLKNHNETTADDPFHRQVWQNYFSSLSIFSGFVCFFIFKECYIFNLFRNVPKRIYPFSLSLLYTLHVHLFKRHRQICLFYDFLIFFKLKKLKKNSNQFDQSENYVGIRKPSSESGDRRLRVSMKNNWFLRMWIDFQFDVILKCRKA